MNNDLEHKVNLQVIDTIQDGQFTSKLFIMDTVPANSEKTQKLTIDNLGDFLVTHFTGDFETLALDGVDIIDNGVCSLRTQIVDEANSRKLTNDLVPLNLLLTPGRTRSTKVTGTDDSAYPTPLFLPIDFTYLLNSNSVITFRTRNDSDTPQTYKILLHGIKFDSTAKK